MIYLDNAATSFPKPPEVLQAVKGVMEKIAGNPGRGGHPGALAGGRILERCREQAAMMLGAEGTENIIFTFNGTDAVNLALKGFLHQGDEVIVSHQEHNAVMRPLMGLQDGGQIRVRMAEPDAKGVLSPESITHQINGKTALVVINHASNVTGCIQPLQPLIAAAHKMGVPVLVDAAQTAGTERLDHLQADMIAMPGHKGLLGPMGTGLLYVASHLDMHPVREGGTGSASESLRQPGMLPDLMESGTHNLPGIAGLCQGMKFVQCFREEIREYERALARRLEEKLRNMAHVQVMGAADVEKAAIVSFNLLGKDPSFVTDTLVKAGFALRGGLHCAPAIHAFHGTKGAVRVSPGLYNTEKEMDALADEVSKIQ